MKTKDRLAEIRSRHFDCRCPAGGHAWKLDCPYCKAWGEWTKRYRPQAPGMAAEAWLLTYVERLEGVELAAWWLVGRTGSVAKRRSQEFALVAALEALDKWKAEQEEDHYALRTEAGRATVDGGKREQEEDHDA